MRVRWCVLVFVAWFAGACSAPAEKRTPSKTQKIANRKIAKREKPGAASSAPKTQTVRIVGKRKPRASAKRTRPRGKRPEAGKLRYEGKTLEQWLALSTHAQWTKRLDAFHRFLRLAAELEGEERTWLLQEAQARMTREREPAVREALIYGQHHHLVPKNARTPARLLEDPSAGTFVWSKAKATLAYQPIELLGADARPLFLAALADPSAGVRRLALGYLPRVSPPLAPILAALRKDKHEKVRAAAAFALDSLPSAKLGVRLEALAKALETDASERVRKAVLFPLIALGKDPRVRAHKTTASVVKALARALQDSREGAFLRRRAAEALASLGEAAKSAAPALRQARAKALLGSGIEASRTQFASAQALARIGLERDLKASLAALASSDMNRRALEAEAIGEVGARGERFVAPLLQALDEPGATPYFCVQTARALGKLAAALPSRAAEIVAALRAAFAKEEKPIWFRGAAAQGLGLSRQAGALEGLWPEILTFPYASQAVIAKAAGPAAGALAPAVSERLSSPKSGTQFGAIQTLIAMGAAAKPALPALRKLAKTGRMKTTAQDGSVAGAARRAIEAIELRPAAGR